MDARSAQFDLLLDIEARHDDLMRRLEELDKRVERTLAEWQQHRTAPDALTPGCVASTC